LTTTVARGVETLRRSGGGKGLSCMLVGKWSSRQLLDPHVASLPLPAGTTLIWANWWRRGSWQVGAEQQWCPSCSASLLPPCGAEQWASSGPSSLVEEVRRRQGRFQMRFLMPLLLETVGWEVSGGETWTNLLGGYPSSS
jgi:hypothetical protein